MRHAIKCLVCNETKSVNGQKQIELFGWQHADKHKLPEYIRITAETIVLDNPQDRIDLRIDPVPLKTH